MFHAELEMLVLASNPGRIPNFLWWGPERFHLTNPLQRTRHGQGNCVASGQMRGFLKKHRQMCLSCSNHHLHVDCSGFWNFKACIGNSWYFHMSPRALSVAGLQLLAVDRSGEPKAFVPADFGGRGASGDLAVAGRGSGQRGQRRHGSADLQGATRELPDVATGIYCGCWGIYRWLPGDIMMIDGIWVDGGMELDGQFVSAEVLMFDGIQGGYWLTTCIYMSLDGFGMQR